MIYKGGQRTMGRLMAEHIRLPGVYGVIVTRQFAYRWMKEIGFDPSEKGFGSMDYLVFGQKARADSLTDPESLEVYLAAISLKVRRDCLGAE